MRPTYAIACGPADTTPPLLSTLGSQACTIFTLLHILGQCWESKCLVITSTWLLRSLHTWCVWTHSLPCDYLNHMTGYQRVPTNQSHLTYLWWGYGKEITFLLECSYELVWTISYLLSYCMTHCGLLRDSTSFHKTTVLGRYLSAVHLWTLRKHSTLHGLCAPQTYKYPYSTWSHVEFFFPTIYSVFYPRNIKLPLVILFQVWTFYSSELRLHYHLCRACCAVSTISIVWTLPPVSRYLNYVTVVN